MNKITKNDAAIKIQVDDMISAGKRGYLAKIENGKRFFLPTIDRTGYGHSKQILFFEISEDGIYEIQDANFGGRRNRQCIKVENGEIVAEENSFIELLASEESNLPELEGSQKQINWALNIRSKFIAKCKIAGKKIPARIYRETNAKFYIDNRSKF